MSTRIYHITEDHAWHHAQASGAYTPETYADDGFIHCSYPHQIVAVANAKFRGHQDLILLGLDRSQLPCQVIDQNNTDVSEQFPHLYGPIPVTAVAEIIPFPCQDDGCFTLPSALQT